MVDNLTFLKAEVAKHGALVADGAETAISNSSAEAAVFSQSVPGGTLGTADFLNGKLFFRRPKANPRRRHGVAVVAPHSHAYIALIR